MNNRKATKRALLTSVMALVMCVVMLVGTTLAWFTDTASTSVNKIEAGKLDVALEMSTDGVNWENAEGKTLEFKKAANAPDGEKVLWEPGCTYELPALRVVNNGNLAIKYKIEITGIKGSEKLNEAIEWTISDADLSADHRLEAGKTSGVLTIKGHMKEEANNDYQGLSISGIAITVYATQDTVEFDSNGNQYDKDAPVIYPTGLTTSSFESAASVYYYYWNMDRFEVRTATTAEELSNYPAVVAYVDNNGDIQYASDIETAIVQGATTIYCKENAPVKMLVNNTTSPQVYAIKKDQTLTIYGNGAEFNGGRFDIRGDVGTVDLKIYDVKNIYVLGETTADGNTVNVHMENCHNVGNSATSAAGRMFYSSDTKATTNLSLNNCTITKAEAPVYMKSNGSVTVTNCSFSQCASVLKISHKATGTCNVTVKDTTFNQCGCTAEMAPNGPAYLTDDSSSIKCKTTGTMTLTLDNVAINNVVGNNSIVAETSVNVIATNVTVDGNPWSN